MTWMPPKTDDFAPYLRSDSIVEVESPKLTELARHLRRTVAGGSEHAFIRAAFEWVRDQIQHSFDAQDPTVTVTATEVLTKRVGLCYAKSHLLTALLRSEGVPAGFCYQRLATDTGHVLHGLVAVHCGDSWSRLDARGNNGKVTSFFDLENEKLAYVAHPALGERDYPEVYSSPAEVVIRALLAGEDALTMELPSELPPPAGPYLTGLPPRPTHVPFLKDRGPAPLSFL